METATRYALILLAGVGTLAGGRLSLTHLQIGETCPMLGPVTACIIVFAGYALILFSVTLGTKSKKKGLFLLGWMPIFILAAMGVGLEIFGQDICPTGAFGIPQCFYSLAMALLCLSLFIIMKRYQRHAK